ncbi:MAG: Acyl-CoA synthetase (AMP-forming)/AMP-acid ligase [Phycisphaerales bacterium]|nr:Acyl-CoA synthetase (AMP-forming)/AMP-acid ligase [Phycisphaerales bacterium]
MKFAFASSFFPASDFETIAAHAKEFGFDGVELAGAVRESGAATNVFLTDPAKVGRAFEGAGVEVACLDGSIIFTGVKQRDAESAQELKQAVSIARNLNCRVVTVGVGRGAAGSSAMATAMGLGDWLLPLGDWAADHGVMLVVKNGSAVRTARQMWSVLDRLRHPAIASCWDVVAGASAGEGPLVSVPVLNSKIQYTHVPPPGAGEGDAPVRKFLTRLQGIGYGGYVTVDSGGLPSDRVPEAMLPEALKKLREWMTPPVGTKPAHKKLAAVPRS